MKDFLPFGQNFVAGIVLHKQKMSFYILTSNPQIIRGNLGNWKITRYGHASKGRGNTRINSEKRGSLSRKRITVSLQYVPASKSKELATFITKENGKIKIEPANKKEQN